MENNLFAKWESIFDSEAFQEELRKSAKRNDGDYEKVPHGTYEVSVEKMELKATKTKGEPMVSIKFKIVSSGEFKGRPIYYNQVITRPFLIHKVNEFLRAMVAECTDAPIIDFKTLTQYDNLLMDVHEAIAEQFEFSLVYGVDLKGYDTFKITEVFALED